MSKRFVPSISQPCPRIAELATSDEKRWYCSECKLDVHNFSAMSSSEQCSVLANAKDRVCIAYQVQPGAIPLRPTAWLWWQRLLIPWRLAWAALAMLLPFASISDAASRSKSDYNPPSHHTASADGKTTVDCKTTGGAIIPERPLWQRVIFFWKGGYW